MPKKLSEKKLLRKAQEEEDKAKKLLLKKAYYLDEEKTAVRDVTTELPAFSKISKHEVDAEIKMFCGDSLPPELKPWFFEIVKFNMKEMYEDSGWGWTDSGKRKELYDEETRFLVVLNTAPLPPGEPDGTDALSLKYNYEGRFPIAMASFRYVIENEKPVLYVYELQVDRPWQRRGISCHLMVVLEIFARRCGLKAVVLTVFDFNEAAKNFYMKKMHYIVDEDSPSKYGYDPDICYEILSKQLS